MAKGKRIAEGKTLVVYSTKVQPDTRALLDALAKVNGPDFGQRELLEEMIPLYMAAQPDKAEKARAILALLGYSYEQAAAAPAPVQDQGALAESPEGGSEQAAPRDKGGQPGQQALDIEVKPKKIQTVRYVGRPQVHVYEPGSKNSTGCGLAGHIDPATIEEQSPDAVDCKKCRYCRKPLFQ